MDWTLTTDFRAITKLQRRLVAKRLADYEESYPDRDEAMFWAYQKTAFTMVEIGAHFGVGYQTVKSGSEEIRTPNARRLGGRWVRTGS